MRYTYLIAVFLFLHINCKAQGSDLLPELRLFKGVYSKYALDENPIIFADSNLVGIWKMDEDPDPHNYFVIQRRSNNAFAFTYMNRGGSNRTYENYTAFFSKVAGRDFLNVLYWDAETDAKGYFFLEVTDLDSRGWKMTLALASDTGLKGASSRADLRAYIGKNINNPNFFSKPVHLHKILPLMFCR
jgi:hypothetical protein